MGCGRQSGSCGPGLTGLCFQLTYTSGAHRLLNAAASSAAKCMALCECVAGRPVPGPEGLEEVPHSFIYVFIQQTPRACLEPDPRSLCRGVGSNQNSVSVLVYLGVQGEKVDPSPNTHTCAKHEAWRSVLKESKADKS